MDYAVQLVILAVPTDVFQPVQKIRGKKGGNMTRFDMQTFDENTERLWLFLSFAKSAMPFIQQYHVYDAQIM